MSTFDLTRRLARESRSTGKDTILFDKVLTGFVMHAFIPLI